MPHDARQHFVNQHRSSSSINTSSPPHTHSPAAQSSVDSCSSDALNTLPPYDPAVGDAFGSAADAKPVQGQRYYLPTHSAASTIPRAAAETDQQKAQQQTHSTWHYPSPQRFYNAMRRKGYQPDELDVPTIVAIHNTVNETAWKQVMRYEQMHKSHCPAPALLSFRGRPNDLSPKAWLKSNVLGYVKPFDRHDWVVDRCGKQVEYVIDFYTGNNASNTSAPYNQDLPAMYIDARPKVSVGGVYDRTRMMLNRWLQI